MSIPSNSITSNTIREMVFGISLRPEPAAGHLRRAQRAAARARQRTRPARGGISANSRNRVFANQPHEPRTRHGTHSNPRAQPHQNPMHQFQVRPSLPSRAKPRIRIFANQPMNPGPGTAFTPTHAHSRIKTPCTNSRPGQARHPTPNRIRVFTNQPHEPRTRHGTRTNPRATAAAKPHAPIPGPAEAAVPLQTPNPHFRESTP
jgi:hypothetical protein